MTREEFMKHAEAEIDQAFRGHKNRMMNLVEQAWAEGKRNAEADAVISVVKDALESISEKKQEPRIDSTGVLYHVYCEKCGNGWWTENAFPDTCPGCGKTLPHPTFIESRKAEKEVRSGL